MKLRKPNFFEKFLLIIGIIIIGWGYFFVQNLVLKSGFSSDVVATIFLWLILIVLIIMTAVSENMKEELALIIGQQAEEVRLLRQDLKNSNKKKR